MLRMIKYLLAPLELLKLIAFQDSRQHTNDL